MEVLFEKIRIIQLAKELRKLCNFILPANKGNPKEGVEGQRVLVRRAGGLWWHFIHGGVGAIIMRS